MTATQLVPDPHPASAPAREAVQLGGRTVELAPEDAATVRQAFQDLATSYGSSLDEQRRQILSTIGTPQWNMPPPQPVADPILDVPDPDLLFSNKQAWADHFAANLEARIRRAQGEQAGLLQGAIASVDQELKRRDVQAQAQVIHDTEMEAMLDRRNLGDHRRLVQAIYNEQYVPLQHLPLGAAFDQIGALAEQEIARIRGGEPLTSAAPTQQTTPPRLLSSGRRVGGAEAAPVQRTGKTLTDLIRAHHVAFLEGTHAA
jgi:hypothetical protein